MTALSRAEHCFRAAALWLLALCLLVGPLGSGPVWAALDDHCTSACPCDEAVATSVDCGGSDGCGESTAAGGNRLAGQDLGSGSGCTADASANDVGCLDDCVSCSCCGGHAAVLAFVAGRFAVPERIVAVPTVDSGRLAGHHANVFRPPRVVAI